MNTKTVGLSLTLLACALATFACSKVESPTEHKVQANKIQSSPQNYAAPIIPTLSVKDLANLTFIERDELTRRCLGINHPTCDNLKSPQLQSDLAMIKATCDINAAFKKIDRAGTGEWDATCKQKLGPQY